MRTLSLIAILYSGMAMSDEPKVLQVQAEASNNSWTFSVTLTHADEGWDHFADGWGVYLPDGTELGYRTLYHPHVNEMPFTRSLSGVEIPEGVTAVLIRPRDSVHGEGPVELFVLPR